MYAIISKEEKEVLGKVGSNRSMTFDEVMECAGFEYLTFDDNVDDGWYDDDGTLWDESSAAVIAIPDDCTDDESIIDYYKSLL